MIDVRRLAFSYKHNRPVLKNINFYASKGQCTAILGNNGAGKSTLIKCLNRILEPEQGIVHVGGKNIFTLNQNDIAKCMAYVAQHNLKDRFTVYDSVLLGRKPYITFEPDREDYRIVEAIIKRMKLEHLALCYLDELSGGEIQKVILARALAQQPDVLLLDEPTSNLDLGNQHEVLATIREIAQSEQIVVIIIIHDLNLALRYCDRFMFLSNNRIFACGGVEIMTPENIKAVYGIPVMVQKFNGVPVIIPIPSSTGHPGHQEESCLTPPDKDRVTSFSM